MNKTITLGRTGFHVEGTAFILDWWLDEEQVTMDDFHVDSLDDIPRNINDGGFGCKEIISAVCDIYEDYDGYHVFLETRRYERDDLNKEVA